MWRQLVATVDQSDAETVSDWLERQGALSISLDDAGDEPLFEPPVGETPLWHQVKVTALFDAQVPVEAIGSELERVFGGKVRALEIQTLEDQVWERAWMAHFSPMPFGKRLWICPTGFEPPKPDAVNVILDPGLAFGTGTHPTTALCLAWLDSLDLRGKTLLDYGCGSGILAIAAICLGAVSATGIDIDPQALLASRDNAQKNGVLDRFDLHLAGSGGAGLHDVVVANILAGPLVELAPAMLSHLRPEGRIALSGLLRDQAELVLEAYRGEIDFDPIQVRDDWVLLSGIKTHPVSG